ncbi:MAG TPA: decaprenyl-phosphate phosphoribosyltransferase [Anaerolineaceae bacterium]|nr:decaprenyl-phosphate phosphoribosyltransferase [Anaerolineaceae bacterium]
MLKNMINTLRPRQWLKNLVIFAGIVFDGQLGNWQALLRVSFAFILFCLLSGLVYTINDLMDIKADRAHPKKRHRPIASGALSTKAAISMAIVLALIIFPAAFFLDVKFGIVCSAYFLLMLAYSRWLKYVMIIDVMIIAIGFVLRMYAGIAVITVQHFSPWLYILTSLLALFLAFGKRHAELKLLSENAGEHRVTLRGYTLEMLNQYLVIVLSAILITYMLYTFAPTAGEHNYMMMFTIPFVIYGIFRYMEILQSKDTGAAPEEVLLSDRPLQATIVLWAVAVFIILYIII